MIAVHKYPLATEGAEVEHDGEVLTHAGAEFLTAQKQNGVPCLWARVDTERRKVKRAYKITGTGESLHRSAARMDYVGTCQIGAYVWHVFVAHTEGET